MVTGPGVSAPPSGVGASIRRMSHPDESVASSDSGSKTMPPGMPVGVETPPAGVALAAKGPRDI